MTVVEPMYALRQTTLDQVLQLNQISPNLLTRMLFPVQTHKVLSTDTVQWDILTRKNQIAPFRAVNGEPVDIARRTYSAQGITTPYLAVRAPLSMSSDLLVRWAGQNNPYVSFGQQDGLWVKENIERTIAEDLQELLRSVQNTQEWMVAQLLTGKIEYVSDEEGGGHFELSTNKPSENNVDPNVYLDTKSSTEQSPDEMKLSVTTFISAIQKIKMEQARRQGPAITDGIVGEDAANHLQRLIAAGAFKDFLDKNFRLENGSSLITVAPWSNAEGTLYLGTIEGVRLWAYTHALPNPANPSEYVRMIRGNYIEFMAPNAGVSERRLFFGAITNDLDAVRKGLHVRKYFTKTLKLDEPSSLVQILKSRPLPYFRRPDWFFSLRAVENESVVPEPLVG